MDRVPASARKGWWTFREVADAGNVAAVPGERKGSVGVIGNDDVEEEGKGAGTLPPRSIEAVESFRVREL